MKDIPDGLLDDVIKRLVDGLHPEKIILFGSHAYGTPNKDSDIDLLVVISESDEPRYRRAQKAYSYLWGLTVPVELIILTHQEVDQSANLATSLVNKAIKQGRILYGCC
jgi:predicted nucleotidyltransferase